jgi:cyclase
MPLAYGGGIRTLEQIDQLLTLGVEKVVINSRAFEDPGFVRRAADKFGSQSILVSIDARKSFGRYRMFTRSGTKATGLDPVEFAQNMEHCGAGEILITSIDRDGTMQGYDLDLIHTIACAVSVPVIASGGAAGLADISEVLVKGGASAASAGSMFVFHGKYRAVLISYLSPDELETLY